MNRLVFYILIGLTVLFVVAAGSLFAIKAVRRRIRGREQRRKNRFIDMIGELVVQGEWKARVFRRYASDTVFRKVLLEYLRMITGSDRQHLMGVARQMGMVAEYTAELRSSDRNLRVRAAEALAEIADPETLTDLVFALADPVPEVRVQAAAALAHIGDGRAVKSLLATLDQEDAGNAQRLADALYGFGSTAVDEAARYLSSPGNYRPLVARTLGLIGDIRAEEALMQALDSADQALRIRAAAALGRAGTPRSVPYLLQLLSDDQWEVRAQAATAVGSRMDQRAVPWLKRALTDDAWWVRHNAAASLVEIPGGGDALRLALDHPDAYARDAAAAVLLSSGLAGEAVGDLTSDDPLVRNPAMDLVMKLIRAGKGAFFINEGVSPELVSQLHHGGQ
jgi:HEAT repeat protein